MAISPDPALEQKLREQPAHEYCLRLAQEMKAYPPLRKLPKGEPEAAAEQTKALTAALEDSWSKAFLHVDKLRKIDELTSIMHDGLLAC